MPTVDAPRESKEPNLVARRVALHQELVAILDVLAEIPGDRRVEGLGYPAQECGGRPARLVRSDTRLVAVGGVEESQQGSAARQRADSLGELLVPVGREEGVEPVAGEHTRSVWHFSCMLLYSRGHRGELHRMRAWVSSRSASSAQRNDVHQSRTCCSCHRLYTRQVSSSLRTRDTTTYRRGRDCERVEADRRRRASGWPRRRHVDGSSQVHRGWRREHALKRVRAFRRR